MADKICLERLRDMNTRVSRIRSIHLAGCDEKPRTRGSAIEFHVLYKELFWRILANAL